MQSQRTVSLIVKLGKGKPGNPGEGVGIAAQLLGNFLVGGILLGIAPTGTSSISIGGVGCRRRNDNPGRTLFGGGRVGQVEVEVEGREGPTGRSGWCWFRCRLS